LDLESLLGTMALKLTVLEPTSQMRCICFEGQRGGWGKNRIAVLERWPSLLRKCGAFASKAWEYNWMFLERWPSGWRQRFA